MRHYIEVECKKGVSKKQIVEFIDGDPSILSRELNQRVKAKYVVIGINRPTAMKIEQGVH